MPDGSSGDLAVSPETIFEIQQDTPEARQFWGLVLEQWRNDIALFAWDVFGVRLWRAQRKIARQLVEAVNQGIFPRMAVKSGQKTGKSLLIAVLAIWWWLTRPNARVVLMAPTGRQVRTILWTEVQRLWLIARARFRELGGLGGRLNQMPALGLQHRSEVEDSAGNICEIIGFSANKPENAAGISGDNLFFLIDEASGISEEIFETIDGNRSGGAPMIVFSNPTQTTGYFYRAFHASQGSFHALFTISSEETPNVITGRKVIRGLAIRDDVLEKRILYGPDYKRDPRYRTRVLGEFPTAGTNQVITPEHIARAHAVWYRFAAQVLKKEYLLDDRNAYRKIIATQREAEIVRERWTSASRGPNTPDLVIGVDPARYGDDMAVARPRRGNRMFQSAKLPFCNGRELADLVMSQVRKYRHNIELEERDVTGRKLTASPEKPLVIVDDIGLGSSPYDYLEQERAEIILLGIRASDAPSSEHEEDYVNRRAELHFGMADWINAGGGWEPDETLEEDLMAARYFVDKNERAVVESKDQIKARLGRSPDEGDAAMISVFDVGRPRILSPEIRRAIAELSRARPRARGTKRR